MTGKQQFDRAVLDFIVRLRKEHDQDAIVISFSASENPISAFERSSCLSETDRDEIILQTAARLSSVFAPHLGEALLAFRKKPGAGDMERRTLPLPDEGGDKAGGE